jgi:hypothetical protein
MYIVIYIRYLHYKCLTQFRDVCSIYARPLSVQGYVAWKEMIPVLVGADE